MFSRWNRSLKFKIFLTCGVLICICVTSALSGWGTQSYLLKNFAAYERTEQTGHVIADIDRRVQLLKAHTQRYVDTGSESRLAAALALEKQLVREIATVESQNTDAALADLLTEMKTSLASFGGQLALAAEERGLRTQLVSIDLPAKGQQVRKLITELHTAMSRSQGSQDTSVTGDQAATASEEPHMWRSVLLDCSQSFSSAEQSLARYIIDNNAADFSASLASLREAGVSAKSIVLSDASTSLFTTQGSLQREIDEYERLGTRAFQATRGYLYYSDVVLAGDLSEFGYLANRLQAYVQATSDKNRRARDAAAGTARWVSVITCVASILLGVILSTRLSQMILSPVMQLTATFRRLSAGDSVDEIPAIDRVDEMGRMAQAAKVFSEKNQETKKLSEELTKKAAELQEINHELDNFAYIASHDLRSPLRGINHLAHWVKEDCEGLLPQSAQGHLDKMQQRVNKMDNLLNDLLEYSRAGRIRPQPEHVDIGAEVQSIVEMIEIMPEGFVINVQPNLPLVFTVRTPLHQVLLNLISNAVKYNNRGQEGRVDVRMRIENGWCNFEIEDNGPGVPPEYHAKIFEMYQRVDLATEGTGMGLAISKKQVEAYGGTIGIDSQGEGATFIFSWRTFDEKCEPVSSSMPMDHRH